MSGGDPSLIAMSQVVTTLLPEQRAGYPSTGALLGQWFKSTVDTPSAFNFGFAPIAELAATEAKRRAINFASALYLDNQRPGTVMSGMSSRFFFTFHFQFFAFVLTWTVCIVLSFLSWQFMDLISFTFPLFSFSEEIIAVRAGSPTWNAFQTFPSGNCINFKVSTIGGDEMRMHLAAAPGWTEKSYVVRATPHEFQVTVGMLMIENG